MVEYLPSKYKALGLVLSSEGEKTKLNDSGVKNLSGEKGEEDHPPMVETLASKPKRSRRLGSGYSSCPTSVKNGVIPGGYGNPLQFQSLRWKRISRAIGLQQALGLIERPFSVNQVQT